MVRQILNWRIALAIIAILIVSGTIIYSQYLAKKIAKEERQKVEEWVKAITTINNPNDTSGTDLALMISQHNDDIPIIVTNEKDSITDHINLDSSKENDKNYLRNRLATLKSTNKPIDWQDPLNPTHVNHYYYGHTKLLKEVQYYPIIQLCIVALFIIITFFSLSSSYRSVQNQVWAGMAKETAHQLGTPVSSLEGWVEMLKEKSVDAKIIQELEKDVDRLRLVSDRFGKIGSSPQLDDIDLVSQINNMVDYMRKRATGRIIFSVKTHGHLHVPAKISAPLFDWVIENLLKNALDAMEGRGSITIDINDDKNSVTIDIADTGKGISSQNLSKVFKPGFTTKKRGWGLGLSLSKRIIEKYHRGQIFVKQSEAGKGTTFRIVLKK